MPKKLLQGIVVKDKLKKTITVLVARSLLHPKYKKIVKKTKKYIVHDSNNIFSLGDKVSIVESRPISKRKKWIVLNSGDKK